jgi:hypothetical protein
MNLLNIKNIVKCVAISSCLFSSSSLWGAEGFSEWRQHILQEFKRIKQERLEYERIKQERLEQYIEDVTQELDFSEKELERLNRNPSIAAVKDDAETEE